MSISTVDTLQAMLFAGVGFAFGAMGIMDSTATAFLSGVVAGGFSGLMVRGNFVHCMILSTVYVGFAVIGGSVF